MKARDVLSRELEALRSDVQQLRDERRSRNTAKLDDEALSSTATNTLHGHSEWDEVQRQIEEIAGEIARASREHPAISVASAFAIGVLVGRMLPR